MKEKQEQHEHPRLEALALVSRSLSSFVSDDPRALDLLLSDDLPEPDAYAAIARGAIERAGIAELRLEKRRHLAVLAARDAAGELDLRDVGAHLSALADACVAATLVHLGDPPGFAVISMGKLGGYELNYSSDIDLMLVAADGANAADLGTLSTRFLRELGGTGPEGQAFRIDMNLRPEGRSGALVRSLSGYLEYYRRWAKTWEFQALIKARATGGDPELGARFIDETRPFVYERAATSEGVDAIRKMKERVEEHASRSTRGAKGTRDDVKLGPGGIRDIEFSVQLLQLVHGGSDPAVRSPNTLEAIAQLVEGGYIAEDDGAGLAVDYRWLRNVEHRIQLWQERQSHVLPEAPEDRARIARSLGFRDTPAAGAAARFEDAHRRVLADVRGRFEKVFYRPMVESLADAGAARLSPEALRERLRVLGFRDVERAARTLTGLVSGRDRRAKLFRVLTPALLRFLAPTPQPDQGLFSFLRLGEALEGRVDALGALRDNPPGLEFLATVLGSGRFLGEVLAHVPEELAVIADPRGPGEPKDRARLTREAGASLGWRDPDARMDGLRRFKRRETLKIALDDLAGTIDVTGIGEWLGDLASACLDAALGDPTDFAVVGLGKLGGRELNYASDVDVIFVHRGDPEQAERRAEQLLRAVGEVTPEGQAFRVDAALRPEGKSGPLSRSLESYLEYYGRWAEPWEHQALIKARPVAGDEELAQHLVKSTRAFAFPEKLSGEAIEQMRHLKARMEKERVPRGTDPRRHLKLGPGGIADVEFSVQLLQRLHGHSHAEMQVTGTLTALAEAVRLGLIEEDDAARLRDAFSFLMKMRNRIFFMFAKPVDAIPTKPEELEALGIALGFKNQPRQEVEETYLRITRRARKVAERVIYGRGSR
ncbi:MAG TPA: bifunctional [glutamine synthetase] adenylyltransferase/[glutamine synthetase]-adenylyl-L-tyrosine phosphorylase [Actinomycetota bacterium]|nr:bifunctional [glutamine synthetase] adenylyltransferase/[glutamine synthetase]-adenylyl-L-tyrosine phosphorylase [Actinomycetota bacterium]